MQTNSTTPRRRAATDLLADIRSKLAATSDASQQDQLLKLGVDLLRRRQNGLVEKAIRDGGRR